MTNPLTVIPAKYRKYAYALLTLAAIIVAGIQASGGDWLELVAFVLVALGFGTATSNTDIPRVDQRGAASVAELAIAAFVVVCAVVVLVRFLG